MKIIFTFQGCQPFSIPPCKKTYECSSENSKVPECWIKTCSPASEGNLNKTEIETSVKTRSEYYYSGLDLCANIFVNIRDIRKIRYIRKYLHTMVYILA